LRRSASTGIAAAQPKISNYSNAKGRFTGACAVGLHAQGWPPGTEFLDAETGRQKSPPKCVNARRDQNPGCEWPEIPAERPYLTSYRKRAVCGDWMVGAPARRNRSPMRNSLRTGQLLGIFWNWPPGGHCGAKKHADRSDFCPVSCSKSTAKIFWGFREPVCYEQGSRQSSSAFRNASGIDAPAFCRHSPAKKACRLTNFKEICRIPETAPTEPASCRFGSNAEAVDRVTVE
jgi:hypothetical protein